MESFFYFSLSSAHQISAVRLPREPSNPERLKGFGYAEFDDVESLLRALSLSEEVRGINLFLLDKPKEKGVKTKCLWIGL